MINRKQTWDILLPILQGIDKTFSWSSMVNNGDGTYTLSSCNTKWLTYGYTITIDTVQYKIVELSCNNWIKVKDVLEPAVIPPQKGSIQIYSPYFYHATIIAQATEIKQTLESWNKLPMVYLQAIVQEDYDVDKQSAMDRQSFCNFYFMIDADFQNWTTGDHRNNAVMPMRNLAFEIIELLKSTKGIGRILDFSVFDHARWGVYIQDKGHTEQIFKDNLSGTQVKITIPFLKSLTCSEC